jgi:diguanylate cyclase (GGDEF)-like protein/PAS domain S-box-containing protein
MRRLRAMVEIAGGMVETMTSEDRLAVALSAHLAADFSGGVSVWFQPADGGPLRVAAAGHPPDLLRRLTDLIQGASGVPHPSLVSGQAVVITDDADLGGGVYLVPMSASGRLVGVVAAAMPAGSPPADDDLLEFVIALADAAAGTLANARVLADATAVTEDLRAQIEVYDDISDALVGLDNERRIVAWNAGAERVYGYARADALGCDLFALLATRFVAGDGQPLTLAELLELVAGSGNWRGEVRERRADGLPLTVLTSLNVTAGEDGTPRGYVLVNRDVTDQRRQEHRALHDALTGLPNRRMLTNRLYDGFARACRNGTSLAVMFVDLSQFRVINEQYGRDAGDEVLRATAERLVGALRDSDTVSRVQDDDFVVVLERIGDDDSVQHVADRIARALVEPVRVSDHVVQVRPTIGAALVTGAEGLDASPDRLIEIANDARHLAKAAGTAYALEHLTPMLSTILDG